VTRREQHRADLVREIKAVALEQIATRGATAVSWRGIAAQVGMNPASLYTYFASLHDLYTALIADGFVELGAALDQAVRAAEPAPRARALAWAHAYRDWARDNGAWFNLCFTDVLPGYQAPPDGPTVVAQRSMFEPLAEAVSAGGDADEIAAGVAFWASVHGATTLEVNHQVRGTYVDVDRVFDQVAGSAADAMLGALTARHP
jgi:AcrR family transcriptional regulator